MPADLGVTTSVVIALLVVVPALAGAACVRAARHGGDTRRGWSLLALFAFVWAVAGVVWVGELVWAPAAAEGYPAPSDVIFLLASLPMLVGVIAFPTPMSTLLSRRQLVLDVMLLTASVLVVKWALVLPDSGPVAVGGPWDVAFALSWIAFDAVVTAVVLAHWMRESPSHRLPWGLLAAGLGAIAVANSFYYRLLASDAYRPGAAIDWGYVIAFLLIGGAALLWPSHADRRSVGPPRLTTVQETVPYAVLTAAVGITVLIRPTFDAVLVALWVVVVAIALARRLFLVVDHVRVTNELQRTVAQQTTVTTLAKTAVEDPEHTDMTSLLQLACELVADALDVPLAKINELQPEGDLLVVAGVGWEPGVVGEVRLPGTTSWRSGYALRTGRLVTSEDMPEGHEAPLHPVLEAHGVVAGVSVPIRGREEPYGVLSVHTQESRRFSADEEEFLQLIADVLGSAVERAEADTKRTAVEEELQRLTARLQAAVRMYSLALESGKMGVWEYDVASDRITPSRTVVQFYGPRVTTGERTFADAVADVHPDDRRRVWDEFHNAMDSGQRFTCEYRFVQEDGTVMWVQDHARIERDADGRACRVYGVTVDVTEQKKAEEELELRARHLRQAQKMESLGQLAGGVAHDFNNLLTAILGNTELLESRLAPSPPGELREVRTAAQRAKGLVEQLLAFSRLQPNTRTIVDANAVLDDLSDMLVRLIGSHIDVRVVTAPTPAWVGADRVQLQQVVLNLATNARDAMTGGGVLELRTEVDEEEGLVRLVVRDTGAGMPPEVLAHVYEPFYTTKPEGEGTGMGLAVVYGVVVQNDGDVHITSEVGEGTTVVVELPYDPSGPGDQADEGARDTIHELEAPDPAADQVPMILAVEDQPQIRSLITTVLEGRGHHVQTAGDGVEAIELAASLDRPLDVLITDVVMPRLNGPDLASRLREDQPDLKVLFISGYTRDVVLDSSQPGSAFLQKPFGIGELVTVVEQLLADGQVDRGGDAAGAPTPPD